MGPRAGGVRGFTRSNVIAGAAIAVLVVGGLLAAMFIIAVLRGRTLAPSSDVLQLALKNDPQSPYTVLTQLGPAGTLVVTSATMLVIAFAANMLGQWVGTLTRRPAVASVIALAAIIFTAKILGPNMPAELRLYIDIWTRTQLSNYVGDPFTGKGGIPLIWIFVTPLAATVAFTLAIWRASMRRGIAKMDE